MTLRVGDELVKLRGGATKRVRVVRVVSVQGKPVSATLEAVGTKPRRQSVDTWPVPLDERGLPEGYRRVEP